MHFGSVFRDGAPMAVAVDGSLATPLRGLTELGPRTPLEILRDPPLDHGASFPAEEAAFRPVVPRPGKIVCVGLNYRAHVQETKREESEYPATPWPTT